MLGCPKPHVGTRKPVQDLEPLGQVSRRIPSLVTEPLPWPGCGTGLHPCGNGKITESRRNQGGTQGRQNEAWHLLEGFEKTLELQQRGCMNSAGVEKASGKETENAGNFLLT